MIKILSRDQLICLQLFAHIALGNSAFYTGKNSFHNTSSELRRG